MPPPNKSGRGPMLLALILTPLILSTGCAPEAISGTDTSRTICRELRRDLPTYSRSDTPETLASGARFVTSFNAICQ
ncbi:hypothetical protein [Paenirhodobacter populi]|uniref:hypothetical protein n=1 Tax=Paenirhodobacter populi TaxID=2306993 RepID=UPI000FE320AB|nr:hypothetical protein [Sinirhodobacter populi]RWR06002.1 hypothetical protein D2T32_14935 [Sinirhodobacter populi]